MPNYIDHRLSARATRQFRRVTSGKTAIAAIDSGNENRTGRWKFKRMTFTASFAMLTHDAQIEVVSAFYAADAMRLLFRFRDPGDYQVTDSPLTVVAGTMTPVQLTKRYTFGPAYADRMIQAVQSCIVTDAAGVEVAGTFDTALGLFTPTANWGAGDYKWTGVFDTWVRFGSDDFDATMETLDIATTNVELVERKAVP